MKLRISSELLNIVAKPYKIKTSDIIGIAPKLKVGEFECCVLSLVQNKSIIISNGIVMSYNKLEDFFQGLEPISLVADETIQYNQEMDIVDIQIIVSKVEGTDGYAEFNNIRGLMFGASEISNEA